jgi:ribosome-associated translation inhibitor RaiA
MTINLQISGMKDDAERRRQVEGDLAGFQRLIAVSSVNVVLAQQSDVSPPYQASAMLTVPGPDIQAAARDHTWLAAWRKVVARLREQIDERRSRQTSHE